MEKIVKKHNINNKVERYNSIDLLKCICCFLIICIHQPFPTVVGNYIVVLSRVAVPIFFMISGFFWCKLSDNNSKVKRIKKLLLLVIYANLLYLVYMIHVAVFKNDYSLITSIFNYKTVFKFLIFNESPFSGHLWYLSAILYTTIIMYIADKFNIRRKA